MKSKQKFPRMQLVEVEWIDSAARGRWASREDYEKHDIVTCRSVGYVVKRSARAVVLVQSQSADGDCSDGMAIPRAAVTKVRRLK